MSLKLKRAESATPLPETPCGPGAQAPQTVYEGGEIPALARAAVEAFILENRVVRPPRYSQTPLLYRPSACFVCIKTLGRELRGCIGTVEPEKGTLAEELIANAIKAATRDPRFKPLSGDELPHLRYSVDVLGDLQPAEFEDLDPSAFGVVVTNHSGSRRGLLLPAINGVSTAEQQVGVASRKAGLAPGEPFKLYRFRTHRFSERV
jgi:AmmeMemoRadiSam system protein A